MEKKNIVGIDLFKLIAAILVVILHGIGYYFGQVGEILKNIICPIAVPFFFISSGYFFGRGLNRNKKQRKDYFIKYEKNLVKMYIVWSIIGIPFMIRLYYNLYNGNLPYIFLLMIRNVLFSGTFGIYWYLLAMIGASILIYFFDSKNKIKLMYILSFGFFIFGIAYAGCQEALGNNTIFYYLFKLTWIVFSCERNFLMVGWFYMSIGYYFSTRNTEMRVSVAVLLFFIFTGLKFGEYYLNLSGIFGGNSISIMHSLQAVSYFLIAINLQVNSLSKYSKIMRELSSTIYFTHFLFIDIINPTQSGNTMITLGVTLLLCIAFYYVIKKINNKNLNVLINS